jgi:6-phosphogluconolactonase
MVRSTLVVVLALGCAGGAKQSGPADAADELPPDASGGTGGPAKLDAAMPAADAAADSAAADFPPVTGDAQPPADTSPADAAPAANPFVYVGSEMGSEILIFQLDLASGALMPRGRAASGPSPDYLAFHPSHRFLYALNEVAAGRVVAFAINPGTGMLTRLNDVSSGGAGPAHISMHKSGKWLLSSNYASGHVAALPIMDDGRLGDPVAPRIAGTFAHMIIDDGVSGKFVFVPSKGDNRVLQFKFDEATGRLEPNTPSFVAQVGAPRHLVFHRSGRFAFLLTEAGRSVISYRYDPATGLLSDGVPLLAAPSGDGSHILLHPTLELLYVSLRFFDSVATLGISEGRAQAPRHFQQQISTPWDMAMEPGGRFLLVANNASDTVKVLRIDAAGALSIAGDGASVIARPRFVGVMPAEPRPQ